MYNQQQPQQGGQQFQKNPNGGYLNRSNYGQDSWYGAITITPELLAQVQRTGKLLVEVKDIQTTQYGECRRCVGKPYEQRISQGQAPAQAVPQQPVYAAAPPQQRYAPQPVQAAPAPAPVQQQGFINDDIPF